MTKEHARKVLRYSLFLSLGIIYLYFYNTPQYDIFSAYIEKHVWFGHIILSYISGIITSVTCFGFIGFGATYAKKYVNTHYGNDKHMLHIFDFVFKFVYIFKCITSLYAFSYIVILPNYIKIAINKAYAGVILLVFMYFFTVFINSFFQNYLIEKSKMKSVSKNLLPVLNKFIVIFIWAIGIVTVMGNIGYNISAILAGAGIGGLAVAFASQKSIANIFGALTIILNKPFKIGDIITVNGVTGTVQDIGLSYLTMIDRLGHQVMIPNEVIISTNIENFSVRKNRRTDFTIGVEYGTSIEKVEEGVKLIENILAGYKETKTISEFRVNFDMFGDFSLKINVTYFSLVNDDFTLYLKQKEEINLEIKKCFKDKNIEMAFPTQVMIQK